MVTLMAELNPKGRLLIQRLHIEEKSVVEIAEITGWTKPVIKVRAFRARKKLQDRLQTLGGESSQRLLSPCHGKELI